MDWVARMQWTQRDAVCAFVYIGFSRAYQPAPCSKRLSLHVLYTLCLRRLCQYVFPSFTIFLWLPQSPHKTTKQSERIAKKMCVCVWDVLECKQIVCDVGAWVFFEFYIGQTDRNINMVIRTMLQRLRGDQAIEFVIYCIVYYTTRMEYYPSFFACAKLFV